MSFESKKRASLERREVNTDSALGKLNQPLALKKIWEEIKEVRNAVKDVAKGSFSLLKRPETYFLLLGVLLCNCGEGDINKTAFNEFFGGHLRKEGKERYLCSRDMRYGEKKFLPETVNTMFSSEVTPEPTVEDGKVVVYFGGSYNYKEDEPDIFLHIWKTSVGDIDANDWTTPIQVEGIETDVADRTYNVRSGGPVISHEAGFRYLYYGQPDTGYIDIFRAIYQWDTWGGVEKLPEPVNGNWSDAPIGINNEGLFVITRGELFRYNEENDWNQTYIDPINDFDSNDYIIGGGVGPNGELIIATNIGGATDGYDMFCFLPDGEGSWDTIPVSLSDLNTENFNEVGGRFFQTEEGRWWFIYATNEEGSFDIVYIEINPDDTGGDSSDSSDGETGHGTTGGETGNNTTGGETGDETTGGETGDNTTGGETSDETTGGETDDNTTGGETGDDTTGEESDDNTTGGETGDNTTGGETNGSTDGSGENSGADTNEQSDGSYVDLDHASVCGEDSSCGIQQKTIRGKLNQIFTGMLLLLPFGVGRIMRRTKKIDISQ